MCLLGQGDWWRRLMAEMLAPEDAIAFSRCCRLSRIVWVYDVPVRSTKGKFNGTDDYPVTRWQPVLLRSPAIRTVLTFDLKEHGWSSWFVLSLAPGDAEAARVCVECARGLGRDARPPVTPEFAHCTQVLEFPKAVNSGPAVTLECAVCVQVGGGAGRSILIAGLKFQQLLYLPTRRKPSIPRATPAPARGSTAATAKGSVPLESRPRWRRRDHLHGYISAPGNPYRCPHPPAASTDSAHSRGPSVPRSHRRTSVRAFSPLPSHRPRCRRSVSRSVPFRVRFRNLRPPPDQFGGSVQ